MDVTDVTDIFSRITTCNSGLHDDIEVARMGKRNVVNVGRYFDELEEFSNSTWTMTVGMLKIWTRDILNLRVNS